jgi:hypothetical protein
MSPSHEKDPSLSPKLLGLLRASKRFPHNEAFNIQAVRDVLGNLYHSDMPLKHCVRLMVSALEELSREPRFESLQSPDWRTDLLMCPLDKAWFYRRPEDVCSMEQFYETIVSEAWSVLQLSRVDWCLHILWPDENPQ